MIKNLTPQLAEWGKIKIGERGETKTSQGGKTFAQPRRLDHFLVTTMQRDAAGRFLPDTAIMSRLTPKNGKLTEIPIKLLYDDLDLNFISRYACYRGARCWCSGDGESAQRLNGEGKYVTVTCPCERQDPLFNGQDRCKVLGTLQVLIDGTDRVGGIWKFRTTSWNSTNAILSSLLLIKSITGGPLAGIPLWLVLTPKTVTVPGSGQSMVIQVVSIEFRGSQQQLADLGYEISRKRIEHKIRMEQIEEQARKLLALPQAEPLAEQVDTAAEFFPEAASPEEVTAISKLVARQVAAQAEDDFLAAAPPPNSQAALELEPVPAPVQEMEGTIPPALLRQIEHQAQIKGVEVPDFATAGEAKTFLKDLMAAQ